MEALLTATTERSRGFPWPTTEISPQRRSLNSSKGHRFYPSNGLVRGSFLLSACSGMLTRASEDAAHSSLLTRESMRDLTLRSLSKGFPLDESRHFSARSHRGLVIEANIPHQAELHCCYNPTCCGAKLINTTCIHHRPLREGLTF